MNKERLAGSMELVSCQICFESNWCCSVFSGFVRTDMFLGLTTMCTGKKTQMCSCVCGQHLRPKIRRPGTDHISFLHIIITSSFAVQGSLHSLKMSLLYNAFTCSGMYGHKNRHMDQTCAGNREKKQKKNCKNKHKHPAESSINKLYCACGGSGDVWCRLSAALFNYCSPGPKA